MNSDELITETLEATQAELALWEPETRDPQTLAAIALALRGTADAYRECAERVEALFVKAVPKGESVMVGSMEAIPRRQARRTQWDNDGLVRAVLDSRLVDKETGEVAEESPVEKLRHVYNLSGSAARTTALKERGIDADQFASTEWRSTVQWKR